MQSDTLFISIDGMTDPLGQSQVIPYLIGLSEKGYSISIISLEKEIPFKQKSKEIAQVLEAKKINWHPLSYSTRIPLISQYNNFIRLRNKAEELHKKNQYSIIHCRNYMAGLIGLFMKKKYKTKFLFDMRGFWANERIDGGIWKLDNPVHKTIYNFFKKKEIEMLVEADYTISLTESAKTEFMSWPSLKNSNIPVEIIPCCADLNHFSANNITDLETKDLKKKFRLMEGEFILSYLGSLGTWYMLEEMLCFFSCLLLYKPEAKFLIITHDQTSELTPLMSKYNIPKEKILVTSATRKEVPALLSVCDFSIYFIKPLYSKKASSPTKLGEILAMGKPVITNTGIGDCDELIQKQNAGILIPHFTVEDYRKGIEKIDSFKNVKPEHLIEIAQRNFSLAHGIELYGEVYEKLASN